MSDQHDDDSLLTDDAPTGALAVVFFAGFMAAVIAAVSALLWMGFAR